MSKRIEYPLTASTRSANERGVAARRPLLGILCLIGLAAFLLALPGRVQRVTASSFDPVADAPRTAESAAEMNRAKMKRGRAAASRKGSASASPRQGQRRGRHQQVGAGRSKQTLRPARARRPGEELEPFDSPGEAQEFYFLKRAPIASDAVATGVKGEILKRGPMPVERYAKAIEQVADMPQYSTALSRSFPSENEAGTAATVLTTWTPIGPGNVGGRTRVLLIDPSNASIMYAAGVAGGVWKSTNGGTSWAALNDLMANLAVASLAMDPNNSSVIYAGTGEGYFNGDQVRGNGIFKTTNGGASWAQLANTGNSNFFYVNEIVVSKGNSQRVYAGTRTGVWRSTDGGTNWTQVHNPGGQGGCLDMVIRTDNLAQDVVLASFGTFVQATVYRNLDAGGAGVWTPVLSDTGMGRTSLAIAPSNQQTMYALAASFSAGTFQDGLHGVFRSTDGGATWAARLRNTSSSKLNTVLLTNPVIAYLTECGFGTSTFNNQGWYDNVIAVDPLDPNRVWVAGIDTFRSDDGGANFGIASHWWATPTLPRYAHADNHAIVFDPGFNGTTNKVMYLGNDGGLFKTTDARAAVGGAGADNGVNSVCNQITSVPWSNLNNGYAVTQFYDGVMYPNGQTYFGGTQDNGTVRGTNAGGSTWNTILGGDGGYVAVDPTTAGNPATTVLFAENTGKSIQKSTNGGTSFTSATAGLTESGGNFLFIAPFIMDSGNAQRLWTGGFNMWRTTNSAGSWTQASNSTCGNGSVSAIAVAPTDGNRVLSGMNDGCINRTNIGLTATASTVWASVTPRVGFVSWLAFDPTNSNIAYATYSSFNATGTDRHVYKSTDAGATWVGIDGTGASGIPDIPVHTIVVDPVNTNTLYIGTDLGVFTTTDGGANWMKEITGFANVVTESLKLNSVSGVKTLFAFTHGRGAWRVQTSAATPGTDTIGLFRPSGNLFFLRNSNTAGFPDLIVPFGAPGDMPLVGDWDGDGVTTIGLYRPSTSTFYLRNSNTAGFPDITASLGDGPNGDLPIVGDWNGDGVTTIGVYRPSTSTFYLRNSNTSGFPDLIVPFGAPGDLPVVGDWDGDGTTTVGLYRPSGNLFFLRNSNTTGFPDLIVPFGAPGDLPVVGDWNGDGTTTVGLYRPSGNIFFLRNSNTAGFPDLSIPFGAPGDKPLAGNWDGL
jgi:hypothetical protein